MSILRSLIARIEQSVFRSGHQSGGDLKHLRTSELVRAQGDWMALLATILERERIVSGRELARSLSEFAAVTSVDRPHEGRILGYWADRLQDAAATFDEPPPIN